MQWIEGRPSGPSSSSQHEFMRDVKYWGAGLRLRMPIRAKRGRKIQHKKALVFDEKSLFTGSLNATGNSAVCCEEVGSITRAADVVMMVIWSFLKRCSTS